MSELGPDDHDAIRALVEGYARSVDARDVERFTALFTDGGELDVYEPDGSCRGGYRGTTELATLPPRLGRYDRTRHEVLTHSAVADAGAQAHGETTCEAHHVRNDGDHDDDLVMAVRYLDRYRRTSVGWRIERREVRVESTETRVVEHQEGGR